MEKASKWEGKWPRRSGRGKKTRMGSEFENRDRNGGTTTARLLVQRKEYVRNDKSCGDQWYEDNRGDYRQLHQIASEDDLSSTVPGGSNSMGVQEHGADVPLMRVNESVDSRW